MVADPAALRRAADALAGAKGPVAVDTERASGYRYSQRAYLVQLRREGAGTWLVDPIALGGRLDPLVQALDGTEWVLHAASQDLPCLAEIGYQLITALRAEEPLIPAGRLVKKLDPRWDDWFNVALDPTDGFATAESAIAALPARAGGLVATTRSVLEILGIGRR